MRHTRLYRDGVLEAKDFPAAEISEYLETPGTVVWLDLCEPDRADLEVISQEFGLHPLAVEDAVQQRERPKLDRYQDHSFLTAYAVDLDTDTGKLTTSELAAFATTRALITVRKDPKFDIEAVVGLEDLLFDEPSHGGEVQRRSFELRKSLVLLRRVVLPMREVVNTLLRRDLGVVDDTMGPYFQDVYDHVLRATEWTESLR